MIATLTVKIANFFLPQLPTNTYLLEHMQVNALLHSGICKIECIYNIVAYVCIQIERVNTPHRRVVRMTLVNHP